MKTSEEQAEAKRLEREQKLKLYQSATQAVFQKVGPSEIATPQVDPVILHRGRERGPGDRPPGSRCFQL